MFTMVCSQMSSCTEEKCIDARHHETYVSYLSSGLEPPIESVAADTEARSQIRKATTTTETTSREAVTANSGKGGGSEVGAQGGEKERGSTVDGLGLGDLGREEGEEEGERLVGGIKGRVTNYVSGKGGTGFLPCHLCLEAVHKFLQEFWSTPSSPSKYGQFLLHFECSPSCRLHTISAL